MKKVKLFKYRAHFETEIQVDGFSDFRDREYQMVREQVTVLAKNKRHAQMLALKNSNGYYASRGWLPGQRKWYSCDIKKIVRVKKSTT